MFQNVASSSSQFHYVAVGALACADGEGVGHLIPIANPRSPFSILSHFGGGSFFDFVLVGDVVEVGFDGWARWDEHAGGRPFEDIAFADEPVVEALASFL